jgi:hypothetical protein
MLSAVRCVEQGPAATIQTVQKLDTELVRLKISLVEEFGLSLGDRVSGLSPRCGLTMEQFLYSDAERPYSSGLSLDACAHWGTLSGPIPRRGRTIHRRRETVLPGSHHGYRTHSFQG